MRQEAVAEPRLTVHWAWISKHPGAAAYGIAAASAGDIDFSGYVGQYVTGVPEPGTPSDAPASLPWVTFGPFVSSADELLISVSVQDPWRNRDNSSRDIFPQRLFLMPYTQFASAQASYQQLWTALRDIELPTADGLPLTIVIRPQPLEDLVETIQRYGLDRMTALAAMILEDKVVLADTAAMPRHERLAVLDAALALLPYGFRAAASASSAVNNTVSHVMDLVLAEFVNEANKQVMVRLSDSAPLPSPHTRLAQQYRAMLLDKAKEPGLHAVVEHLWASTEPCSLQGQQGEALHILAELDFNRSLLRALGDGTASRAQLLSFFSRDPESVADLWRSQVTPAPIRHLALQLLLDDRDGGLPEVLLRHWPTVADDLCSAASSDLDRGEPALSIRCLHSARRVSAHAGDLFLARLLASEQAAAASDRPKRLASLVRLLESHPAPAPGSLPCTLEQVSRDRDEMWQSRLFQTLLAGQMQPGGDFERAAGWASWICLPTAASPGAHPPWMASLRVACGSPPQWTTAPEPGPSDIVWAGVVLRLAAFGGRLSSTLPAVAKDLVNLAADAAAEPRRLAAADPDVRFLLDSLDVNLWGARVSPDIVAVADLTRLLLGGRPSDFPESAEDGRILDAYGDGLGYVLGRGFPENWRSWLVRGFLRRVVTGTAGRALSAGAVWLLNSWSADPDLSPEVARHIAGMDEATRPVNERLSSSYWNSVALMPALAGYATVPRLTAATHEAVAAPEAALARQSRQHGITHTTLALTCYGARQAGLPVSEILRVLSQADAHRISPRRLDDVIREFQGLLHYDSRLGPQAHADLFECYDAIAGGALGGEYAGRFARELAARSQDEIRLREELIRRMEGTGAASQRKLSGPGWGKSPGPGVGKPPKADGRKPADQRNPQPGESQPGEPRPGDLQPEKRTGRPAGPGRIRRVVRRG